MLDAHCQFILDEYKENMPIYNKMRDIIVNELNGLVSSLGMTVNGINSRIKTEKSLTGKLERKGYKYKSILDITDIVGAMIVTFYSDEVDKISASIGNKFAIDWENSIDKRKMYNIDQFGYMSLHYICKIPESLYKDETMPLINQISFEIQIKTTLQHAWASIQHDIGYKHDIEVPKEYLRRLSRLAGMLELADAEFKSIRCDLEDYRKKVKSIVADGKFEECELDYDSFTAYIDTGVYDSLNKQIATINNMDIVNVPLYNFLTILKGMRFLTLGDIEKMRKDYSTYAYKFAVAQFEGTDIDIISSSVGLTNLCICYLANNNFGLNGIVELYNTLYGDKNSNLNRATKALEITKKIGIYKE